MTYQPMEDGLVDQGGPEDERHGRHELRQAVHLRRVHPVEHFLEGDPAVSSEGRDRGHHHEQHTPSEGEEIRQVSIAFNSMLTCRRTRSVRSNVL